VRNCHLGRVIKRLVKHMNMNGPIATTNGGTRMTPKGKAICDRLMSSIPAETSLSKRSVALGKFNHAVLLKDLSYVVRCGIEQRDAAIKMNATGAELICAHQTRCLISRLCFLLPSSICEVGRLLACRLFCGAKTRVTCTL
jgi:hypothetical protein